MTVWCVFGVNSGDTKNLKKLIRQDFLGHEVMKSLSHNGNTHTQLYMHVACYLRDFKSS